MNKYASIINNNVVKVSELDEQQFRLESKECELLVDITNMIPEPEVGWVLNGNKLELANDELSSDEQDLHQQKAQRKFGVQVLEYALDAIGARNLKLTRESTPADVATLAQQMASIKLLLEGGALKTARTICLMIKPTYPNHADILQTVIDDITQFINKNNF